MGRVPPPKSPLVRPAWSLPWTAPAPCRCRGVERHLPPSRIRRQGCRVPRALTPPRQPGGPTGLSGHSAHPLSNTQEPLAPQTALGEGPAV